MNRFPSLKQTPMENYFFRSVSQCVQNHDSFDRKKIDYILIGYQNYQHLHGT